MLKKFLISLVFASLFPTLTMAQPIPKVRAGTIERLANFPSRYVDARHIDVWLPDGYSAAMRCQVIYMHDGQMLFDPETTWNHQSWDVDATMDRLIKAEQIAPTIVVGIWNNGIFRHAEYFPQKQLAYLTPERRKKQVQDDFHGAARADSYLRFLVEELKPEIDRRYATRADAASTFLIGSSSGGLISVYAMSEYPNVFGGAAGLSTHWVMDHAPNAAMPLAAFNYLRDHMPDPSGHRLYQDHGTIELDALYAPYQQFVDEIARDRGYTAANYQSLVFEGAGHNENAWAARLEIPVLFLLGKP